MTVTRKIWIAYLATTAILGLAVGTIAYVAQTSFLSEFISIPAIPLGIALLIYAMIKPLQIVLFKRASAYQFYSFVYLLSSILALTGLIVMIRSKVAHTGKPFDLNEIIVSMHPMNLVFVAGPLLPATLFIWLFERATQATVNVLSSEENK